MFKVLKVHLLTDIVFFVAYSLLHMYIIILFIFSIHHHTFYHLLSIIICKCL